MTTKSPSLSPIFLDNPPDRNLPFSSIQAFANIANDFIDYKEKLVASFLGFWKQIKTLAPPFSPAFNLSY